MQQLSITLIFMLIFPYLSSKSIVGFVLCFAICVIFLLRVVGH